MRYSLPLSLCAIAALHAEPAPVITDVDVQPLAAQARRVLEAAEFLGEPFSPEQARAVEEAAALRDVAKIQAVLDSRVMFAVTINPEMRVKAVQGPAKPELVGEGWRLFLVKVLNEAGTTAPLRVRSPQGQQVYSGTGIPAGAKPKDPGQPPIGERWLDLELFTKPPMKPALSGLAVEYVLVSLYSRDSGKREARFSFDVGQGTQDLGFRSDCDVLFQCRTAREITLRVRDEHGKPTTGAFLIRDRGERVYPSQAKRLAPDFWFHPQIYRADGESVRLPDGDYTIEFSRGPESLPETRKVSVNASTRELAFQVRRWVDAAQFGWWSGDHHIHAAGCKHYSNPSEGVLAPDMARHCKGEDLKVGANLTWGPCFDYQKQFFTGKEDAVSQWPYLLRYDVEVSGFGSHKSGHLCLLLLREQMYPGGDSIAHWPTLGLNTLRWAKKQGAVCGPAHSGWGLAQSETSLPTYEVPKFDGIGACEYIVDVTHEVPGPDGKLVPAVDFMSTVDTPAVWELNTWYHTLNAGFRTRISGETDFPCIYGERVGLGRSYVKLPGKFTYEDWCEGIRAGRAYVGDGRSHLIDFKVNAVAVGEPAAAGAAPSELRVASSTTLEITAKVAAFLPEKLDPKIRGLGKVTPPSGRPEDKPYWHIERARIAETREVPVEVIVNGNSVARRTIVADGTMRDVQFTVPCERSSWVALRILPSSHTNPVFVLVGGRPVRPSRRSVEWCLKAVDQCWSQKEKTYLPAEHADAVAAYEHARKTYRARLAESDMP
ncbi:MAG: CehA/McbA family metallohydrolase [Chthoniobacteraceae bacterium]